MRKHCYLQVFNRLKEFTLWEFCEIWCNLASLLFLQRDILMHRWRYPSLSLHGIEGAFSASGAKTVIPRKVIGKFSIRLVPNMTPEEVTKHVCWDALFSKQQSLGFLSLCLGEISWFLKQFCLLCYSLPCSAPELRYWGSWYSGLDLQFLSSNLKTAQEWKLI